MKPTITRFLTLALVSSSVAYGSAIWGIVATTTISSGNGPSTFASQIVNFNNAGNPVPVTSYTSPILSASGSFTFGVSTVSGSATSWDTVTSTGDGLSLHGFVTAGITGACQTCAFATENGEIFDPIWYDTLIIGGLPIGTPVDLMLTGVLHSTSTLGGRVSSSIDLGNQEVLLQNTNGNSDGFLTGSMVVHTVSGANLSFVDSLFGDLGINNLFGAQTGTIDASNTANAYISVLTTGANYTSASGLTYDAPSSVGVPEPASLLLSGPLLVVLWFARRRRGVSHVG